MFDICFITAGDIIYSFSYGFRRFHCLYLHEENVEHKLLMISFPPKYVSREIIVTVIKQEPWSYKLSIPAVPPIPRRRRSQHWTWLCSGSLSGISSPSWLLLFVGASSVLPSAVWWAACVFSDGPRPAGHTESSNRWRRALSVVKRRTYSIRTKMLHLQTSCCNF